MPWLGLLTGALLWRYGPGLRQRWSDSALARGWRAGWGFDALYDALLVRPLLLLARLNRKDLADQPVQFVAWLSTRGHAWLSITQNGRLRRYAAGIALGAVLVLTVVTL
jgi:NADH-quinone oxidoreductase subunit L